MRSRRYSNCAANRGFTLIELLVSIVILSTGIVLVLEAFQTALVGLADARELLLLDMLARQRVAAMDVAVAEEPYSPPESAAGRFSGRFKAFDWEQRVESASEVGEASEAGRVYDVVTVVGRAGAFAGGYRVSASYFIPVKKEEP